MKHVLKIEDKYYKRVLSGEKTFEVRKNDRDYQVGDKIQFKPCEKSEYQNLDENGLLAGCWTIAYIYSDEFIKQGYVILAIT